MKSAQVIIQKSQMLKPTQAAEPVAAVVVPVEEPAAVAAVVPEVVAVLHLLLQLQPHQQRLLLL